MIIDDKRYNSEIGPLLKTARKMCGISQSDLANLIGSAQSLCCRVEKGALYASYSTMSKLIDVLELDPLLMHKFTLGKVHAVDILFKVYRANDHLWRVYNCTENSMKVFIKRIGGPYAKALCQMRMDYEAIEDAELGRKKLIIFDTGAQC